MSDAFTVVRIVAVVLFLRGLSAEKIRLFSVKNSKGRIPIVKRGGLSGARPCEGHCSLVTSERVWSFGERNWSSSLQWGVEGRKEIGRRLDRRPPHRFYHER